MGRRIGQIVSADPHFVVAAAGIGLVGAAATPDADHVPATLEDVGPEVVACPVDMVAHQFEVAVFRVGALAYRLEVAACCVDSVAFWLVKDFLVVVGVAMVAAAAEEAQFGAVVEAAPASAVEAATHLDTVVREADTAAVFQNLARAGRGRADKLEAGTLDAEVKASLAAVAAAQTDEQALLP